MVLQYPVIYCKSVVDFSEIFILKKKKKPTHLHAVYLTPWKKVKFRPQIITCMHNLQFQEKFCPCWQTINNGIITSK